MKRKEKKWFLTSRLYEEYLNKECIITFIRSLNLSEPQIAAQMNVSYPYLYRVCVDKSIQAMHLYQD